jgi:MEMO1 family protein
MNNFISRTGLNFSQKRHPSFAGTWYESDAKKLHIQLQAYLAKAKETMVQKPIETGFKHNQIPSHPLLAIVAPHAGYMFSGPTAAFAYEQAKQQKPERIFLLGPSHYVGFDGAMLPEESVFATPLGDLAVDKELIQELSDFPLFRVSSQVHKREHSLEMQLPLIKECFGDVKIVPIIIGMLTDEMDIQLMAQILRRYLRDGDLVVVSSDFTHFGPRYEYEPFHTDLKENIRKLDAEAFAHLSSRDLKGFIDFKQRTEDTICGFYPCSVLLALLPEGATGSLLRYGTSQDTLVEDDRNSVSYLALAFSNQNNDGWENNSDTRSDAALSVADKANLLKASRLTLESIVQNNRRPNDDQLRFAESEFTKKMSGAFVTLYKIYTEGAFQKELRGCIGYIWPVKPLWQTIVDNTIGSCSRDHRFPPVTASELEDIEIDINVLTAPKRVNSYSDIVVGRDGVVMYKDGKQAVFLPSVANEFGWDLPELLTQLSLKAGLTADAWKQGARFDIFQSESFSEGQHH